jgi:hypothetical protein
MTPRPEEQAHFDFGLFAERNHRGDLFVGQHHDTAALTYPMKWNTQGSGFVNDGPHRFGTLDRRYFNTPRTSVREPARGGRKGRRSLNSE